MVQVNICGKFIQSEVEKIMRMLHFFFFFLQSNSPSLIQSISAGFRLYFDARIASLQKFKRNNIYEVRLWIDVRKFSWYYYGEVIDCILYESDDSVTAILLQNFEAFAFFYLPPSFPFSCIASFLYCHDYSDIRVSSIPENFQLFLPYLRCFL